MHGVDVLFCSVDSPFFAKDCRFVEIALFHMKRAIPPSFAERFKSSSWLTQFLATWEGTVDELRITRPSPKPSLVSHKDENKQLRATVTALRVLPVCIREQLLLVNSVSFLVTEGIDSFRALSAYLLVFEWEFGVNSGNRHRLLPKGLTFGCNIKCTCNITLAIARNITCLLVSSRLRRLICDYRSGDLHWICQRLSWPLLVKNRSSTMCPSTIVPYEPRLTGEPPLRGLETRNVISPAILGQG